MGAAASRSQLLTTAFKNEDGKLVVVVMNESDKEAPFFLWINGKAAETKALADAKMGQEIGDAKKDAASEKTEADYKVAHEKCDALAGDAKASCVAAAKAKFGKN